MKRLLIALIIALPFLLSAQTITEGQSTMIYSLPKTELVVNAVVEKITETPGEFYQYSERYLATSDVITSKQTFYRLKYITLTPRVLPDKERTFTIIPGKKSLASLITVNDQGILCGINVPSVNTEHQNQTTRKVVGNSPSNKLLPLNEEYMLAGSVAKMAEGAAKLIYRIRENRMDLLAGDVEHTPTDGASMKTMIEQMNKQEKELTQLFTGTTTVEELTQEALYSPSQAVKDKVVFRFSSFDGLIPADDLSGEPFYLTLTYEPVKTAPNEKKKKAREEVFSIVPVTATVSLDNGQKVFYQNDITLPQLGELMPLPLEAMDRYSRAYVSPETGRLLSVEQGQK